MTLESRDTAKGRVRLVWERGAALPFRVVRGALTLLATEDREEAEERFAREVGHVGA